MSKVCDREIAKMKHWLWLLILLGLVGWPFMSKIINRNATIGPRELLSMMNKKEDFVLIDVREKSELISGTIPGAIWIPLGEIDISSKLDGLNHSTPIVVMCRSGARSARAQQRLFGMGFEKVYNLRGGILAWDGPISK